MIELLRSLPVNDHSGYDYFESENCYPRLAALAAELNPKTILEIGVRLGYSAISFLSQTDVSEYVGLDMEQYVSQSNSAATQNLEFYREKSGKTFKFELITLDTQTIKGYDLSFLGGRTFDLIHVDGDHSEEGAYNDMVNFWSAVNIGGHMLVDDSIFIRGVHNAIQRFLPTVNEPNWNVDTFRGTWVIKKTKE